MSQYTPAQTVLHIAPTPFFSDRGCHIRIRNEIKALADCHFRVILCTYPLGDDVAGLDIRRTRPIPGYHQRQAGFSPYRIPADVLLFFLVLRVAWVEKPRILHAHLHEGILIGWLVRWCLFWRRMAVVMDMQGSLSGELVSYGSLKHGSLLYRLLWGVEWLIYRLPAVILCSSRQSVGVVRHQFGGKNLQVQLLADVVPDEFFDAVDAQRRREELGLPQDKHILIFTGSLMAGKGLRHLFETMRHFKEQQEEVLFLLVGYPVKETERFLAKEGLAGMTRLTGRVAYEELARWLPVADLALEPKEELSGEASGKLLHYMAAGLPVVCFKTANNQNILQENGYFAPLQTRFSKAVAAALADSRHERLRKGKEGQKLVRKSYSLASVGRQLSSWYGKLAEQ